MIAKKAFTRRKIVSTADLAKHLDISRWTVSRAINGHPEVNIQTREHVLRAMEELNFQPNLLAQGLRGRKTGLIGVSFKGLDSPILNTKIYHLQNFLRTHGLRTILEITTNDPQCEARIVKDFNRIQVDGVILINSSLAVDETRRLLTGLPCVQVDPSRSLKVSSIALDRGRAMRLLLEHLLRLGHRRFGLLSIEKGDHWRWPSLRATAVRHGLDPERIFLHIHKSPAEGETIRFGRYAVQELLRLSPDLRPTALISVNDLVAIGAIQTLKEAGIKVPEEISVTGFDHLDIGQQLHPTLTTIEQNPKTLMERAGKLLLEQIVSKKARSKPRRENIPPRLILGESTGPLGTLGAR